MEIDDATLQIVRPLLDLINTSSKLAFRQRLSDKARWIHSVSRSPRAQVNRWPSIAQSPLHCVLMQWNGSGWEMKPGTESSDKKTHLITIPVSCRQNCQKQLFQLTLWVSVSKFFTLHSLPSFFLSCNDRILLSRF